MAIEIKVPDIGADEVEITEILVKVGDKVEAEQSLITVEGDKASMEVPAPFAGTVKEIKVNVGDKVSTGSLIMVFEVAGEAGAAAPAAKQEAAPAAASAPAAGVKEVNVPDIGGDEVEVTEVMVKVGDKVAAEQSLITVEGDKASMEVGGRGNRIMASEIKVTDIVGDEVEITENLVKVWDKVEAEQSLITVEGDKASMEVPSPQAGIVKEIKVSVGDKTKTGALIMIFDSADGAADAAPAQAEEKKEAAPAAKQEAAPSAASAPSAGVKEFHVPDFGGDEVEVTEVMVKVGDKVAAEQSLITVEGDKASMEVPAPFAGGVNEMKVNVGEKV